MASYTTQMKIQSLINIDYEFTFCHCSRHSIAFCSGRDRLIRKQSQVGKSLMEVSKEVGSIYWQCITILDILIS